MASYDYDLFVIGAGSGGVRASRMAAAHGARVAVAEAKQLGGTCVNVGCIPKKLFVYASHFAQTFEDAAGFGWERNSPSFDLETLIENKNEEIARLNGVYAGLLDKAGVTLVTGLAKIVDPHAVEVEGKRYTAKHILVAVGGRPERPSIPGIEHCIVSDDAFFLDRRPERVIIGGGGYIGVEFAGIFHGMGARVTVVHRGDCFLRGFDDMVRLGLAEEMRTQGIHLRFGMTVEQIEKHDGGVRATLADGSHVDADLVLCAMGRVPMTAELGVADIGVALDARGAICVDEYSRSTTVPSVFAVGDVTDRKNLTPMALAEGAAVAETLFNDNPTKPDHHNVPSAVFSQPPIGTVGMTEAEAAGALPEVDVYETSFVPLKHRLSRRMEKSRMKLLVDARTDRVVGLHVIGEDAAEIVQGFAVAVKLGATKKQLDQTIGIHPTAAEELVTMRTKSRTVGTEIE